jgi:hypothetical protein
MMHITKIVLHPKLENEHRQEVKDWMSCQLPEDTWYMNSNYDEHGCFNITIEGKENTNLATAFMLKYPETIILEKQFHETYEIATEALSLFEFE